MYERLTVFEIKLNHPDIHTVDRVDLKFLYEIKKRKKTFHGNIFLLLLSIAYIFAVLLIIVQFLTL